MYFVWHVIDAKGTCLSKRPRRRCITGNAASAKQLDASVSNVLVELCNSDLDHRNLFACHLIANSIQQVGYALHKQPALVELYARQTNRRFGETVLINTLAEGTATLRARDHQTDQHLTLANGAQTVM